MKYRVLGPSNLTVSEIGFGAWTVSTNWWGKISEPDSIKILRKAYDLGINLFDTADTYGEGYGEEILAKALKGRRHELIISTKFGYDFYTNLFREGHKERPQKFTPQFIRFACEQSLRRLQTDYIDLYQLHNPRIAAIEDDAVFETLEQLVEEGKIRYYGSALGPDIGWFEEGEASMRIRHVPSIQIIYSIFEQDPARDFFPIATEENTGLLTRVPHASGLLDGSYNKKMVFEASDHRSHRKAEWLETGLKKLEHISFLTEHYTNNISQIAIKFVLAQNTVSSVLPNITSVSQLEDFAAAPDTTNIAQEDLDQIRYLYNNNFLLGSQEVKADQD